jgi:tetratricopeptide (TPR) repeat protein
MSPTPPSHRRAARAAASRRTRAPAALTRGGETLAGAPLLDEVRGDLGVVLWRSLRNVNLWALTPPAHRGALFSAPAAAARQADVERLEVDAELAAPLLVVVRLLESPSGMDVPRLVNACRRVALWAEQRGHLATALEWAQAAALAAPHVAALAFSVGRLARRRAEYDRAESWYARAIAQARRSADWRTYALGYTGLGNLYIQKGSFPAARRAHQRSLAAALRHDLHDVQGAAYHNLYAVELEAGRGGAEADALASFRAYGPGHSQLPRVAFDVAFQWMEEGMFDASLRLARALEPHLDGTMERAMVLSMIARSAGGAGDRAAFDAARAGLEEILEAGAAEDAAARTLLGIAYGASSLDEWALAGEYAERALRHARERREGKMELAAEAALEFVGTRARSGRAEERPTVSQMAAELAEALRTPGEALANA